MEFMKANDIRKKYLDFFKSKEHYVKNSFSLVPKNDKSLLLINAGMAPLKNYFLGIEIPPSKRMATCQKCVRTGDIENVGRTARHATFFEMLGNFSFGDYFKKEATSFAWEFVTKILKLDEDKLWVTVYEEDDEAFDIWKNKVGVSEERIVRLGKDDNFWEIGNGQGPCGPCSEIYIDRGKEYGCDDPNCKPGCDCDRFLEFWNLVFTQFDKQVDGSYKKLEHPNIDTGMGLERMACIMQGVDSIFDIDTMKQIRTKICEISGKKYNENEKTDVSIRIITDHLRAITFMVSDGIVPSNEGRGYVLRRLARRAIRHAKLIGIDKKFINDVANVVIDVYADGYEDLVTNKDYINKILKMEEEKFNETLDTGINILNAYIEDAVKNNDKKIKGEDAFKLYDTYGFPLELTIEIAEEKNCSVDKEEFENQMQQQRERARNARAKGTDIGWKDEISSLDLSVKNTEFVGYDSLEIENSIQDIIFEKEIVDEALQGQEVILIFDRTPFYAESGGQVGDIGQISGENFKIIVNDVKKSTNGLYLHHCTIEEGRVKKSEKAVLKVDKDIRFATRRNHTATHLLHKALKIVLGDHIQQAGSLVSSDRLRFDFNHFSGMSKEEISMVEKIVNEQIYNALDVKTEVMSIEDAKNTGAMSLFDEKYGDMVRVLSIGDFSKEFCGGTHVTNSNDIGMFKITSEGGVASGVRRIEAITGLKVYEYLLGEECLIDTVSNIIKSSKENIEKRITEVVEENKSLDKKLKQIQNESAKNTLDTIIKNAKQIKDVKLITYSYENMQDDVLRDIMQEIIDKTENIIVIFSNVITETGKLSFICMVAKSLIPKYNAGKIVKEVAVTTGGNGGGKPNMAQAGGKDISKISEAFAKAKEFIENI
ncbi:alanine--tRNA ligase [Peptoanaerobacter stomatis]|uniref:Alanine--tRNA ligase n=1 Tax=Peptoanaerobacter stomatis TaxID=796937 RepID=J6HJQ2_9FIRM|nr:alanine--tRNA ligase [Peptoanaerobacter stomatis]NWO25488.1 alanine--tRNA ligase [Peptostreptococcaceae bacterium oral taxon 081]